MSARAPRYPGLGATIVHVIPADWGPFVDIRASYESLSRRRPWTLVISPTEYCERMNTWLWNDPDTIFVCWTVIDPGPKYQRKSKVVTVYSEALDDDGGKLLPDHLAFWHLVKQTAPHWDAIVTHTPMTAEIVRRIEVPTFVMPVGYDVDAMGRPRWRAPKHERYLYHGSLVGRRQMAIPYLKSCLGNDHFVDRTGSFGRSLLGQLDLAQASLYVAHSNVASFSTWRLWQTAATSAAMVAEPGDTWPFEANRHYVPFERLTLMNTDKVFKDLVEIINSRDLLNEVANRAHEEIACRYTVDYVEDHYVVPMILAMQRSA